MKAFTRAVPAGVTVGRADADCEVVLSITENWSIAELRIQRHSTKQTLATFVAVSDSSSNVQSTIDLGIRITFKLQQNDSGKQTFKFDAKKRVVSISAPGTEASCQLN